MDPPKRLLYCTQCGEFQLHGGLLPMACGHTACMRCAHAAKIPTSCGTCNFDIGAISAGRAPIIMLIPRPRDGIARLIVEKHCILRGMVPAHHIPALRTEEIAQAFDLLAPGEGVACMEAAATADGFRLARYMWGDRPCIVFIDTNPLMFTLSWGGVRSKAINQDNVCLVTKRLMSAMSSEFVQHGHGRTNWLNIAGNEMCAAHWGRAFGEELCASDCTHLRYMAYDLRAYLAVAIQAWVRAKKPAQLQAPSGRGLGQSAMLSVPRKTANGTWTFKGWPPELATMGLALITTDSAKLVPVSGGTEMAWSCVAPPSAPVGMAIVSRRDGKTDISSFAFSTPEEDDTEANNYPLPMLYYQLCIDGVRTAAAVEIAIRVDLAPGNYII